MANGHLVGSGGKAIAMNLLSPLTNWEATLKKRVIYWGLHLRGPNANLRSLLELTFVQFARWVIIHKGDFRQLTHDQPKETLQHDYLLFCSNYNGQWDQYLDSFSAVYNWGLDGMWEDSLNWVPGRYVQGLKKFVAWSQIKPGNIPTDYYYCAYPEATNTDINAALDLRDALHDFAERMETDKGTPFLERYHNLLYKVQHSLGSTGDSPVDGDLVAESYNEKQIDGPPWDYKASRETASAPPGLDLSMPSDFSPTNQSGQAYGLTMLSPIRAGEVDKVRAALNALPRWSQDKVTRGVSPFARTEATHTARWVIVENLPTGGDAKGDRLKSSYLLFDSNFDTGSGGLDPYLDDLAIKLKPEIESIYSHCVGFVVNQTSFPEYVHRCQIETTFFFSAYAHTKRGSVQRVKEALQIQRTFIDLVVEAQGQDSATVERSVSKFLTENQP